PADAIGKAILAHDPLAVALAILQIEWMTQQHYLEGVKDNQDLDPLFKSLLKHRWMEEAQHARLDVLMVEALAECRGQKEIESAFEEYLEIGGFIADGLNAQTQFDLESFERATNRKLTESEREKFVEVQTAANRYTYLGSGMTHPNFLATLQRLKPELRARVEEIAPSFC